MHSAHLATLNLKAEQQHHGRASSCKATFPLRTDVSLQLSRGFKERQTLKSHLRALPEARGGLGRLSRSAEEFHLAQAALRKARCQSVRTPRHPLTGSQHSTAPDLAGGTHLYRKPKGGKNTLPNKSREGVVVTYSLSDSPVVGEGQDHATQSHITSTELFPAAGHEMLPREHRQIRWWDGTFKVPWLATSRGEIPSLHLHPMLSTRTQLFYYFCRNYSAILFLRSVNDRCSGFFSWILTNLFFPC